MNKPIMLNVVSGKGGTGKSLLCAVVGRLLAQESTRVLLVDLDIFVRGLTHFHYRYIHERREITDRLSVSDYLGISNKTASEGEIGKERFFEVDLIPAVREIEQQLDYLDISETLIDKVREFLRKLRNETEYEYIIVDNRAGVDEIVIETSRESDVTISVSESDPISRSTNENLLRHLSSKNAGKVYTIVNKVRGLISFDDYAKSLEHISGDFDMLGQIPFDLDLFESFGTAKFWDNANSTKYAYGLAECWNKLSRREKLNNAINLERFSKTSIWPTSNKLPSYMSRTDSMMIFGGIVAALAYFGYDFVVNREFEYKDIFLIYALVLLSYPFMRRFLFPRND